MESSAFRQNDPQPKSFDQAKQQLHSLLHATDLIGTHGTDEPRTLLVVDDDPITRLILAEIFGSRYTVRQAEDGKTALAMLLADPLSYCAVLLDFAMENVNGIEVLEHLNDRNLLQRIPVFLITAEADLDVTKRAYDLGVMDVIGKPVVPYVVERRVNSVIELFQSAAVFPTRWKTSKLDCCRRPSASFA